MSKIVQYEYKNGKFMMARSRPRLQVVQNDDIANAIEIIRKHRPGLINDSMLVTSALVEYALALESNQSQPANYQTPYGMTIVKTGRATYDTGIFEFLSRNFNHIAAIFAHLDNKDDDFMDYISQGEKPVYTFVFKGKGFTDFEFIHIATDGSSLFEECLTLLVQDFRHHRDDIRFDVIRTNQFGKKSGRKTASDYVPSLDEMARVFFQNERDIFDGWGRETSYTWDLDWEADTTPYQGFWEKDTELKDTRFVDYSHALVGLKPSSIAATKEKYGVEALVDSGVLAVKRDLLHRRYRCLCDGWKEEKQDLDFYELGCIFNQHFGSEAIFSPAKFLRQIATIGAETNPNATVYVEKGKPIIKKAKRIEVLPMKWEMSRFTCHVDGEASDHGLSHLDDDPNPFKLYDMNDFFPNELEQYKQKKKNPKQ